LVVSALNASICVTNTKCDLLVWCSTLSESYTVFSITTNCNWNV